MSAAVTVEHRGAVALVTLNLPAKRNSLVPELYRPLADVLEQLQGQREVRAIVLTGGAHFCAGGPLDGLDTRGLAMRADMRCGHRVIRAIVSGRLPVVAAVEGAAFGAGLSLAAACDFVVADTGSRFGAVFGKVGVMPDWGALWTLPQRVGLTKARQILMFQQVLDGEQAAGMGLVDFLVPAGQVLEHALERAEQLAQAAPGPLGATKSFLARAPMTLDALLDWESDAQALLIGSADFAEGRDAFFAKRAAAFTGL
ncbi:enoyl-CoA hydratase/isomerase family protein [Pseudomonas izuensis]|uniref:enoyl-CoA hydratase/isomerase family protein n=1 Tax=Pseudomonas izuensis TaxID=2684212 RepID=UPI00135B9313|nr:enoyl-CoA hydratase/isomerase family protein [Pseudomonas izuensis]